MIDVSGVGNNEPLSNSSPTAGVSSTSIVSSPPAPHSLSSSSSAIDEIAGDSAKVSLAGTMLSQASTGSDVRFDKVAALRQSIDAGTYSVSSASVAAKLVEAMLT
jgi:negative regulator of flagellin synthesis FlgM